jgi:hypothetical protein
MEYWCSEKGRERERERESRKRGREKWERRVKGEYGCHKQEKEVREIWRRERIK